MELMVITVFLQTLLLRHPTVRMVRTPNAVSGETRNLEMVRTEDMADKAPEVIVAITEVTAPLDPVELSKQLTLLF
jgi:hypothetical protein